MILIPEMLMVYQGPTAPFSSLFACEPILPLMQLLGGSTGLGFMPFSLMLLAVTVVFKMLLFVGFETRLSEGRALLGMLLGNVFSTIAGVAMMLGPTSGMGFIFLAPVILLLALHPAARLCQYCSPVKKVLSPITVAALIMGLYLFTFILFSQAYGLALAKDVSLAYWIVKLLYILVGLTVSLFLTSAWEEVGIAMVAGKTVDRPYFLPTALRVNLYVMLLIFACAALVTLPARLTSPNFLVGY